MRTGAVRSGRAALADAGSPPHRGGMLFYPPAVPGACKNDAHAACCCQDAAGDESVSKSVDAASGGGKIMARSTGLSKRGGRWGCKGNGEGRRGSNVR